MQKKNWLKLEFWPLLFFAIAPGLFSCSTDWSDQSAESPYPGYSLVWSDEFDTDGVPAPSRWTYENGFVRNQELQWYQEDNALVEDGLLIIEGRRETVSNPDYDPNSEDWRKKRKE
jgi:beta-glucanase (GH16 family)